jgi:pectinesterase
MRYRFFCFVAVFLISAVGFAAPSTQPATLPSTITIKADGSGDFRTIQDAIDAIPAYPAGTFTLHILPGIYKQRLTISRLKPRICFLGDDAATTIITFNTGANDLGPDGKPIGTFRTPTVSLNGNDFVAKNITFENTYGNRGQALAAEVSGDRVAFDHCRFLGWQDTLFADSHGRNYYRDCYIEGHVDFIFGKSTAVFDHCEIRSKAHGYLTAASTDPQTLFGLVFLDCKLTADPDVKAGSVLLGRPWRPYAATAFIRCDMGSHIRPEGWFNWDKPEREKTARYIEYASTGPGGDTSKRVKWATQLTDEQAKQYTVENILGGSDHWVPLATEPAK